MVKDQNQQANWTRWRLLFTFWFALIVFHCFQIVRKCPKFSFPNGKSGVPVEVAYASDWICHKITALFEFQPKFLKFLAERQSPIVYCTDVAWCNVMTHVTELVYLSWVDKPFFISKISVFRLLVRWQYEWSQSKMFRPRLGRRRKSLQRSMRDLHARSKETSPGARSYRLHVEEAGTCSLFIDR